MLGSKNETHSFRMNNKKRASSEIHPDVFLSLTIPFTIAAVF